jgi:hypothetical protein
MKRIAMGAILLAAMACGESESDCTMRVLQKMKEVGPALSPMYDRDLRCCEVKCCREQKCIP